MVWLHVLEFLLKEIFGRNFAHVLLNALLLLVCDVPHLLERIFPGEVVSWGRDFLDQLFNQLTYILVLLDGHVLQVEGLFVHLREDIECFLYQHLSAV